MITPPIPQRKPDLGGGMQIPSLSSSSSAYSALNVSANAYFAPVKTYGSGNTNSFLPWVALAALGVIFIKEVKKIMGLFGGDSSSSTTSEIKQTDNKANFELQDNAQATNVIAKLGGNNRGGAPTLNVEQLNYDLTARQIESNELLFGEALDFTSEKIDQLLETNREVQREANNALSETRTFVGGFLERNAKTADEKVIETVKSFLLWGFLFGGFYVWRKS